MIWPITNDSDVDDFHGDDKNDYTKSKYSKNNWHISDSMRSLPKLVLLFNDENETEVRNIEQCNVWVIHLKTLLPTAETLSTIKIFIHHSFCPPLESCKNWYQNWSNSLKGSLYEQYRNCNGF